MDRERGFIVLHRRVRSSALYQSLTAEQRSVFTEVLFACSWKPSRMLYAGRWVTIDRGEFADTLETIAARAGVTVKVVRTTYMKLMAGDPGTEGEEPFMVGRWTGTKPGTGLRVIRVLKYDEYQRVQSATGTAWARDRAGDGHASGTAGAREGHHQNQGNQENHRNQGVQGGSDEVAQELLASLQEQARPDLFQRWFAPLRGRRAGEVMVLEAPSEHHAAFVRDNYLALLSEELDKLGHPLRVQVVVASQAA